MARWCTLRATLERMSGGTRCEPLRCAIASSHNPCIARRRALCGVALDRLRRERRGMLVELVAKHRSSPLCY